MAYTIAWSDSALTRLTEILDFIAERNPAAAKRTVLEIMEKVELLADHPRLAPRFLGANDPDLRQLVAGSYRVIYQLNESRAEIWVLAVQHVRERPMELWGTAPRED